MCVFIVGGGGIFMSKINPASIISAESEPFFPPGA